MIVGQFQAEFSVYLEFVAGVGGAQDRQQSAQGVDQLAYLLSAHPPGRLCVLCRGELSDEGRSFAVDVTAPRSDHFGICPGFECGPVFGEFAVAFGDRALQVVGCGHGVGLCGFESGQGVFEVFGFEYLGEPGVDGVDELVFFEEDVEGVVEVVGEGVFAGVAAAVDGCVVEPVALHFASAGFVDDESFVGVGVGAADCCVG
ncbi:hypothetical protein [Nocardia arizonensis]|uniref:hypothetical protein n=1 Tax=Nocardia arizonensis TaxID=1141647 RepID=UPI001EF43A77|nr:hypothetical protein [Nocardia arizonensis]